MNVASLGIFGWSIGLSMATIYKLIPQMHSLRCLHLPNPTGIRRVDDPKLTDKFTRDLKKRENPVRFRFCIANLLEPCSYQRI